MWREGFAEKLRKWQTFFLKTNSIHQKLKHRTFTQEKILEYKSGTPERKALKEALKNFSAHLTQIPIVIGDVYGGSGDIHYQRMPHNHRCIAAQMSWATPKIIQWGVRVAKETKPEWSAVPVEEKVKIWRKCADILATEDRHTLNASIMLGQSKTCRQAEEDTCRTINDMRYYADIVEAEDSSNSSKGEKSKSKDKTSCKDSKSSKSSSSSSSTFHDDKFGYLMRPTGGFITSMTPYNWTSLSTNLAMCPALMGNCVIWMPSPFSMLSCYQVYLASRKAGLPDGVISFMPCNPNNFVNYISMSASLGGINFAGRLRAYKAIAKSVSEHMDRQESFTDAVGPAPEKNFHFVHESADVKMVAEATVRAAYDYCGQRGSSCECLYVPRKLWCDLRDALMEEIGKLHLGDVCDFKSSLSAVINRMRYDQIVEFLQYMENIDSCEIIMGGNYRHTLGYFIEPTLIECTDLNDKMLIKGCTGPVLCVYVYENEDISKLMEYIQNTVGYTLSGSVFAKDEKVASEIGEKFGQIVANLYINKACIGALEGSSTELPEVNHHVVANPICMLEHWANL